MIKKSNIIILLLPLCSSIAFANQLVKSELSVNKSLLEQAGDLPEEFKNYFFNVPLSAQININGNSIGNAMVELTEDGTIRIINFTDLNVDNDQQVNQKKWMEVFKQPIELGDCKVQCQDGLLAAHYSLENSRLSIIANDGNTSKAVVNHYAQPEGGSTGLILNNRFNIAGMEGQDAVGRYDLNVQGSLGDWNAVSALQISKSTGLTTQFSLPSLYLQKEYKNHFIRAGLFTPDNQGLLRQPNVRGAYLDTALGFMMGSSDELLIQSDTPSLYPVYVTANRDATVEIYKNGILINSQAVAPGLQLINTRSLPGGIYPVEVRTFEDGRQTSSKQELIYKPTQWANPERPWRYNVFFGQEANIGNMTENGENEIIFGGSLDFMLLPRVTSSLSIQQIGNTTQVGAALDIDIAQSTKLYSSIFQTSNYGWGYNNQLIWTFNRGSIVLNGGQSWLINKNNQKEELTTNSGLSLNYAFINNLNASTRLSYQSIQGRSETGVDLSLDYRSKFLGEDAYIRFSVFDRPSNLNQQSARNKGAELSFNMAMGRDGTPRYNVAVGTSADAQQDSYYLRGQVSQDFKDSFIRTASLSASVDQHGVGFGGSTIFEHQQFRGDAYVQRSSYDGRIGFGLNQESTVAIGGGKLVATGQSNSSYATTGVIVDVESDAPELSIRADDRQGLSTTLKIGRNFIPVTAFKSGVIEYDIPYGETSALSIKPAQQKYHLNKGGVAYHKVSVNKTITVVGRVKNDRGELLSGAHVINHATRSVSEQNGFFSIQMMKNTPSLEVKHASIAVCDIDVDVEQAQAESGNISSDNVNAKGGGQVVFVGDLICATSKVASN